MEEECGAIQVVFYLPLPGTCPTGTCPGVTCLLTGYVQDEGGSVSR